MKKAYQRIDVDIFRKILTGKFCPNEEKGASKKVLLEMIQEINKVEIKLKRKNIDKTKIIENINFNEYGFKEQKDVKISFSETLFEETLIVLQAKNIYELEDSIELPTPKGIKQKQYIALMSDTFERLKIKCENILDETEQKSQIELYVTKNLQKLSRTYYDAKNLLKKYRKEKQENINQYFVYVQTIFIINSILYLQKIFSAFYHEKNYSQVSLKYELFDAVGPDILSESAAEYGIIDNTENKLKWMWQINQLATFYYDLNKANIIEATPRQLEDYIVNNYVDKKGNPISRATIKTCLNEYRPDKRAKGKKRIDISKYIEMK